MTRIYSLWDDLIRWIDGIIIGSSGCVAVRYAIIVAMLAIAAANNAAAADSPIFPPDPYDRTQPGNPPQ